MNLEIFNNLIKDVSYISNKIPKKEKTFMDITGYPHYENVSSNILAFYFNPNEEHKLKKLVINSLFKVLKNYNIYLDLNEDINIQREYMTLKGNRIDLVIQNKDFVIGIENKLYASVYNDLNDYADTLNKIDKNSIKILLSLNNNKKVIKNTEFINITYQEFFNQLKIDLFEAQDKNNKWYIFLEEFIKNLENFEGELEMEEEIINWLKKYGKEIEQLDKLREIATKNIEKKQEQLKSLLEEKLKINYIKIWKGNSNMSCYIDSPYKFHVDANLSPDGWKIGLFTWTLANSNRIKQIITGSSYNILEDETNHRWLFKYDYNTSIEEILNKVVEIYDYVENKFKNS